MLNNVFSDQLRNLGIKSDNSNIHAKNIDRGLFGGYISNWNDDFWSIILLMDSTVCKNASKILG